MDKKTIVQLKKRCPLLFALVVKSSFLTRIISNLDYFNYIYCLMRDRPYFGAFRLAGQTWEERKPWMRQMIAEYVRREPGRYIHLLEIGSWAGNSAVIWAEAIKASGAQATVLCVDAWEPYMQESDHDRTNVATRLMNDDLRRGRIFKLFLYNVTAAGHGDTIFPFKGRSNQILPHLHAGIFDIAYIDGDHRYSQLMVDLNHCARCLRDGGILCGDDLDVSGDGIDYPRAYQYRECNVIVDAQTKKVIHPGVCAAFADFFGKEALRQLPNYNGFWAMRKHAGRWEAVQL